MLLAKLQDRFTIPPETVFDYVTDMENYKAWFPGVIEIRATDDLPFDAVGKRYVETIELPTGRGELTIEVKEVVSNRKFMTEGDLPALLPCMTMTFDADGAAACEFSLTYESRNPDIVADKALFDGLRSNLRERGEAGLKNLKKILTTV